MTENVREKIINSLHWGEYKFIIQKESILDYKLISPCEGCLTQESEEHIADLIHNIYKEEGYVKLADDQSLPRNPSFSASFIGHYDRAQQDMLRDNFRRIKE